MPFILNKAKLILYKGGSLEVKYLLLNKIITSAVDIGSSSSLIPLAKDKISHEMKLPICH
jgi:hypothetical protein